MSDEYRVLMVQESTFLHLSAEPLRDGAVVEVERPGSELDGRSVIVYSVLTHPLDGRPGIAYARESPRLVSAQASDTPAASSGDFPGKGVKVSMRGQGGAQEPASPDQPREPMPEEPGTTPETGMPDDPSTAPEAPDMPSDPDREPAQSPPDESGGASS